MQEKGTTIHKKERESLKELFEKKIGRTINTEKDYKVVIEKLFNNETSMMKTLKRVFDSTYIKNFRKSTLNEMARAIGFRDWDDFKSKIDQTYSPHVPNIEVVFETQREELRRLQEDMIRNKNGIYILGWYPEKYIKFKHIENYTYEVLESNRMNRKKGDSFDAPDFRLSKSTTEDSQLPDIMILDNIGYFEYHGRETDDYFYL